MIRTMLLATSIVAAIAGTPPPTSVTSPVLAPPMAPTTPATAPPPAAAPVRETMRALAKDLAGLEETLAVPAVTDADRDRALGLLGALEGRASTLAENPEATSRHPMLATGLPAFRAAVDDARAALKRSPVDAGPARELAHSCRGCHAVASLGGPPGPVRYAARAP
jgi:hypothetical protein